MPIPLVHIKNIKLNGLNPNANESNPPDAIHRSITQVPQANVKDWLAEMYLYSNHIFNDQLKSLDKNEIEMRSKRSSVTSAAYCTHRMNQRTQ